MADFQTILSAVAEYATVSAKPQYWDGIYRRLANSAPLLEGEKRDLNQLIRDWTEYHSYNYNTTVLINR